MTDSPINATGSKDRPPLDYPAGRDIADDCVLSYATKAVYGHLAARCAFGSYITVKAWGIERRLGMDENTVRAALRSLTLHGYITAIASGDSRAKAYRLVWDRNSREDSAA